MIFDALVFFFSLSVTLAVTGLLRRYTLRRNMLDIPNARSSHAAPTPRGGGGGFALVVIVGCVVLQYCGAVSPELVWAVAVGGGLVALVGWLDDRGGLRRRYRFLAHLLAAGWAVAWLPPPAGVSFGSVSFIWGWLGYPLFFLALVWLINCYNFMDGIDGLAAWQGVLAALAGGVLFLPSPAPGLLVAAAVLGFLVWNWPRARIFMGDVGSGFLGYVLGVLWLASADAPGGLWGWPILLAVFLTDGTGTLLLRMLRGEKWRESHRSHAYQVAALRFGHVRVTLAVVAVIVFWLAPWALVCAARPEWAAAAAGAAYAPLAALWVAVKRRYPVR